jgi:hypothetical protein
MRTTMRLSGSRPRKLAAWLFWVAVAILVVGFGGCAPIQFETGRKFDPDVLESSLHSGNSTQIDVRKMLGEPFGTGRALMPFQDTARTVWTYSYQRGSMDIGSGESDTDMLMLFVFFDGDRYDGYIWGAAKLQSAKRQ